MNLCIYRESNFKFSTPKEGAILRKKFVMREIIDEISYGWIAIISLLKKLCVEKS